MIYKHRVTVCEGERGRLRLWRMLALISFLTAALTVALLAYDEGAYAVEGTDEASFVTDVVSDANAYWAGEFAKLGYSYRPADLAFIYDQPVEGGCGPLYPQDGPAYCGADEILYYPLSWAVPGGQPLEQYGYSAVSMGVAHEMGHHVQIQMDELGRDLGSWTGVQHELQADCLAGMWSGRADPRFEAGGPEAIVAALVDLSSQSHGTAEQRISAFGEGYYNGDLSRCLALMA